MSRNTSTSNYTMRTKFGSTSTNGLSQVPTNQQLQTYTDHYGRKWVGKKRDFLNMLIYTYESLGSVGRIIIGKPIKLSTNTTTIEFTLAEPPWSTQYEKRCELEVYCRWHGLRVLKARSTELPRNELANILTRLEQENNQMQRRLDCFHAIQKARKHLKGKAQERAIKSINEVTMLDDKRDISDFSDSSNDDFHKFLPTNIRRCC